MRRLILVHGAGRSPSDDIILRVAALAGGAFMVTRPDVRGGDWAERLEAACESLTPDDVLLGHSHGGSQILQFFAERRPGMKAAAFFGLGCPFWGQPDWEVERFVLPGTASDALRGVKLLSFWHGDDDDVVPPDHLDRYGRLFPRAELHALVGVGHDFETDALTVVIDRLFAITASKRA